MFFAHYLLSSFLSGNTWDADLPHLFLFSIFLLFLTHLLSLLPILEYIVTVEVRIKAGEIGTVDINVGVAVFRRCFITIR